MLESIFILLLIAAIIFLILAWESESVTLHMIDITLWFTLAVSVFSLEIPYGDGTQYITNLYPLAYLFMGIGVIMVISMLTVVFEMLKGELPGSM